MNKISAILFDMDGVLIDGSDWHYIALNQALGLFGVNINREEHLRRYNGLSTRQKLTILSEDKRIPWTLHALISEKKQFYTEAILRERCRPDPVKSALFAALRSRQLKIGVCSNSVRATIDFVLSSLGLPCDIVLSNEDVKNPKPSPDIYHLAMKTLGVAPGECLIVEDSSHGVEAAKQSGAEVMEVLHPDQVNIQNLSLCLERLERRRAA